MKNIKGLNAVVDGEYSQRGFGDLNVEAVALQTSDEVVKDAEFEAKLARKELSPFVKSLTGLITEEQLEKMAKEDPYVRYILTRKYEQNIS
jgi:hypothetical protein